MLLTIPDVLSADEVAAFRRVLAGAAWEDGRATAGDLAARAKLNVQLPPEGAAARDLGAHLLAALGRCPTYASAVLPLRILPPLFNRYDPGMGFGLHTDNTIRALPDGTRMRADVSTTVFLSDPDSYDGGELIIEDAFGPQAVKLPAGHMVIYPASSLHRVAPVTHGSRWASFLWAQSMVRDPGERAQLYDLDVAIIDLRRRVGDDDPAVQRLVNHYHNLLRRWAEL
ncbi:Fe2+-dependent dioxygenase [Xanthobacter sp. V4C-4]|uniref:Fe2+-dependent dioxygenase n=1 Tax=Xanthobacter cornucopiae TaxID=3119924 RepID=UPI00372BC0E5